MCEVFHLRGRMKKRSSLHLSRLLHSFITPTVSPLLSLIFFLFLSLLPPTHPTIPAVFSPSFSSSNPLSPPFPSASSHHTSLCPSVALFSVTVPPSSLLPKPFTHLFIPCPPPPHSCSEEECESSCYEMGSD